MLRLPPTTLSLTVTEVKEFERHLRFKKYLAKEDAFGKLPIRTKKHDPTAQKSIDIEYGHVNQPISKVISGEPPLTEVKESPRLLSCPPRRPLKPGGDSAESGPQSAQFSSPSRTPSSLGMSQPTGWGNLPMALPQPFEREKRSVSDAQTLPSTQHSIQTQPHYSLAGQAPPATPPRRSSLREARTDTRSSPSSSRGRRRLVSSAVRFVELFTRSPSRNSPSPSPQVARPNSSLSARQNELEPAGDPELRFIIYNDALPASSQPQTPYNLPEARHRSRLQGSYTAPIPRLASRSTYHSSTDRGTREATSSPSGLETPGFQGLYGGRENDEDSTLFHEASGFQDDGFLGEED
ncbi:hypothetical protein F5Y06DRAFT_297616 [Hypoxylon sp. FL0890]|nr:hypothetical protein F5Y06DRAFT_297616 [Hypoxylon sp. FL0890]